MQAKATKHLYKLQRHLKLLPSGQNEKSSVQLDHHLLHSQIH